MEDTIRWFLIGLSTALILGVSNTLLAQTHTGQLEYLAWQQTKNGYETAWVRSDEGELEVLAKKEGVFISAPGSLWKLSLSKTAKASLLDCSCYKDLEESKGLDEPGDRLEQCHTIEDVNNFDVVETTGSSRLTEEAPHYLKEENDYVGSYTPYYTILGSVGSRVFVRECTHEYYCGAAHGKTHCALLVYDLKSESTYNLRRYTQGWLSSKTRDRLRQAAYQDLQDPNRNGYKFEDSIDALELSALWPHWGEHGLLFRYQFTGWACYACSDGRWGAYTVSGRASSAHISPRALAYRTAPRSVRTYWSRRPAERSHGWSPIPLSSNKRETLWRSFIKG